MNILYKYLFLYYWEWFLLLNQYVYIDIDYYIFLSIDCIDIITVILYCYNIVTMYYIVVTVYYISKNSDKVYRYKDLIWHIRCCSVDNEIMRYLIAGEIMLGIR